MRQPSHLAWAGSLATLALAVVFGWQFEKQWGPLVKQQQESEMAGSESDEVSVAPSSLLEEMDQDQERVAEEKASERTQESEPVRSSSMRAEVPPSKEIHGA